MIRAYASFLSGITAHQRSLEVAADNVANVNTAAFKRSELSFNDLLYDNMQIKRLPVANPPGSPNPQVGLGVRIGAVVPLFAQGSIIEGGRPLDLAIEGEGFFRIIRSDGSAFYTRQGVFNLDADGRLVTAYGDFLDVPFALQGYRLETLLISPEGVVAAENAAAEIETLGVITLYRFNNSAGLLKDRSGHYLATEASGEPFAGAPRDEGFGVLRQYYLEGSNSDLGLEMVQLIAAQRALQANARGLIIADELQALTLQVRS